VPDIIASSYLCRAAPRMRMLLSTHCSMLQLNATHFSMSRMRVLLCSGDANIFTCHLHTWHKVYLGCATSHELACWSKECKLCTVVGEIHVQKDACIHSKLKNMYTCCIHTYTYKRENIILHIHQNNHILINTYTHTFNQTHTH